MALLGQQRIVIVGRLLWVLATVSYAREQAAELTANAGAQAKALEALTLRGLRECQQLPEKVRYQITHGVGRRLGMMQRSVVGIFEVFPPSQRAPLKTERLHEAQSHLHVFMINLAGVFDNMAWAFVRRHELLEKIGDRRRVGLFKGETRRFFPPAFRDYLIAEPISSWQRDYLTAYRDALAHRIPPYIPPAHYTSDDATRHEELMASELDCIRRQDWGGVEHVRKEISLLGKPCFVFMHEFSAEREARPVLLHRQLVSDCATVVECGERFYDAWNVHT